MRFEFDLSAVLTDAVIVVEVGCELGLALVAVESACCVFALSTSLARGILFVANLSKVFLRCCLSALVKWIFA